MNITISVDLPTILQTAFRKAFEGGSSGASAAFIQVFSLMWLRTAINYQYRYGTTISESLSKLYNEGGIARLYQGFPFAAVQSPLARFGDTAANSLIYSLCDSLDPSGLAVPVLLRTGLASVTAGAWRIVLMPIDTVKTCMQVDGQKGLVVLRDRLQRDGVSVLFNGALAASAATLVGHYPWFLVFNYLSESLPSAQTYLDTLSSDGVIWGVLHAVDPRGLELTRSAFIGLCAGCTSDVCSNSLRVLKTTRQTMTSESLNSGGQQMSYLDLAKSILETDGWSGLFGRGLQTKIISNALQSTLFSVLFKYFQSTKGS
mmetsp:Transcript_26089/g.35951  ORF Transcript_26089/g.35951 Transcript_26089/m.35951 type:complete len:316 (-) Transcript_26089:1754-2701(-)